MPTECVITNSWNHAPLLEHLQVFFSFAMQDDGALKVSVDAPFLNDAVPPCAPGACAAECQLWLYEAAAVFLLNNNDEYLEIEVGPHGHYMAWQFAGERNKVCEHILSDVHTAICESRWQGSFSIPLLIQPADITRFNVAHVAFKAQHASALSHKQGDKPDFHHLPAFVSRQGFF